MLLEVSAELSIVQSLILSRFVLPRLKPLSALHPAACLLFLAHSGYHVSTGYFPLC